jgi:small subunit ribosomal protein S1
VNVKVLDIDYDRQRISLGLKQTQEDPWQRVVSTYRAGDVLEGMVTKVVEFGAFVEILDGVEGLVHISELADHHVENPKDVVEVGTRLNVKILDIEEDRRRLSLSVKRVEGQNMLLKDLGEQIKAASDEQGGEAADQSEAAEEAVEAEVVAEEEADELATDVEEADEVVAEESAEAEAVEDAVEEVDDQEAGVEEEFGGDAQS